MAQTKLLTNYSTLYIRTNGDVLIKPRRMLSILGIIAGLSLALGGLYVLITMFSSLNIAIDDLLIAGALLFFSYSIIRIAWRSLQNPHMLIEKAVQRVRITPSILDRNAHAFDMEFTKFSSVAVRGGGKGGRAVANLYSVGLVLQQGQFMPLVEIPADKIERTAKILAEATGLEIVQAGQQ